jgi:hypothetical protein
MTIIYRWLAWGFVGACILGFVGLKAYIAGTDHERDADTAAMAKQQQQIITRYIALNIKSLALGQELASTRQSDQLVTDNLLRQIANDTAPTITPTASPALPYPQPLLSLYAACMFDARWADPAGSGGPAPAGQPRQPACASASPKSPSQFNVADALYSDGVNAGVCWDDIAQLRVLIQYEKARIGAKPPAPSP